MREQDSSGHAAHRRKCTRLSVCKFLRATATLSDYLSIEEKTGNKSQWCWTGLLIDISKEGAQIILPLGCEKHLEENQTVTMRIKTSLENTNVDMLAQVKSIKPAEKHKGMRIGVSFIGLKSDRKAKNAVGIICEYVDKLQGAMTT